MLAETTFQPLLPNVFAIIGRAVASGRNLIGGVFRGVRNAAGRVAGRLAARQGVGRTRNT